jgi:hypothetical protein
MKTAQFRYTHANGDIFVGIYFDLKAFEFISPPMNKEEEEDFIRLICDSLAAAMTKDSPEKNFYIKRVIRNTASNTLKMLCTDGFLIDTGLALPISQQAFSRERIKLSDIEQLPSRAKLSIEVLKNINDRLPQFEEEVRKELGHGKISAARESVKQEKPAFTLREFTSDKSIDVLSEIGNVKKEIREIAENSIRALKTLMVNVDGIRKRVYDEVMKETRNGLQYEDNKKRLEDFAKNTISQFGGGAVETNKEILNSKINEITPIPGKFENEIEDISQRITSQANTLAQFKQILITTLYDSAKQYSDIVLKQMQTAAPHAKKIMLNEFNKKFAGIAALSEGGELSSHDTAQEKLGKLTFEDLQEIISSDDKENPGLLQKCNTSWTEESPELQIVMKNISQLNSTLSKLFKDDPQFAHYANKDMIQIIRIPFPRSFQFKFSDSAFAYKKAVDDFCKIQKDNIINMSQTYKKTMQLDTIRDKTQRAIAEIQKQTELMKKPVSEYRDLLKRKEASGEIISSANKDHELIDKSVNSARMLLEAINVKIDPSFKILTRKISTLAQEVQAKADELNKIMQNMADTKAQIDLAINNYGNRQGEKPDIKILDEKIKSMTADRNALSAENKTIESLNSKLAIYENAINISDTITATIAQSNMRKQHTEAKGLLLQLIKSQTGDPASVAQQKKHMIELFTRVDTSIAGIDKIIQELAELKNELYSELNSKGEVPAEKIDGNLQKIAEKLGSVETAKNIISENISSLRKLSLESTMEKK